MRRVWGFWLQVWAILWKDVRYEVRSKQTWFGMGMFVLLVLVIFNFTFDLNTNTVVAIAPGALWVAFIFASLLGLGRTVAAEQEQGTMDRLLLTPVDRKAIYLAKLVGNLLFIGVVEIIALPVFAVLFNLSIWQAPVLLELISIELLGALGIASVGTLFSVMAAVTRSKELLLPILIFPLVVPVVISAVQATTVLLAPAIGEPPWLGLLIAFDVIFLSVSTLLFPYVVEE
jgi:heme exporter protein B